MNEREEQNKLRIIFNHFKVLIKYVKNEHCLFFLPDDLFEFYNQFDEYSNRFEIEKKYDFQSLEKLYSKFKIYAPSTGKCKIILQSIEKLFQSLQRQKLSETKDSNLIDRQTNNVIQDIFKAYSKDQINSIKKAIGEYQNKISDLKIQKKVLEQECVKRIQDAADCVNQISDFCKSVTPENIKKEDDYNIRIISDLIYIIEKMQ